MATSLSDAIAPIPARTDSATSSQMSSVRRIVPSLRTMSASGTWPLMGSAVPITAHSATSGWAATSPSMLPVDRRWPATLMTSSTRPMTNR